jgi:hypothetical protein
MRYIVIIFILSSCVSNEKLAMKQLVKTGYNKIVLCVYNDCVCSNGDIYYTGFVATKNHVIDSGYVYKTSKKEFKIVIDH